MVADALSRPPVPPSPSPAAACVKAPSGSQAAARREGKSNTSSSSAVASVVAHAPLGSVDYAAMAAAQGSCPEVQKVAASPALQVRRLQIHGADVLCDVSTGVARPLVLAAFRSAVFAAIHGLVHPGIRATRRLVSSRFVWRGCAADVAGWCRDCQTCQRGKVTRQPAAATQSIRVPERRFTHLHVDLVGLLPTSAEGFKYLFTIIGRWLGQPLWGAGGLGGTVQPAAHPAHHHHRFSPLQQWYGGEMPPPAEGRAAGAVGGE